MSNAILTVIEQQQGKLNRMSWEALAAAQQAGSHLSRPVEAVVMGHGVRAVAEEIAAAQIGRVLLVEDPLLRDYTPDAYSLALLHVIAAEQPRLVLLPHTYQVRDFAPKLAAALQRSFLSDCIGFHLEDGTLVFTRQLFQGKMNADIAFACDPPCLASVQAGSFRADQVAMGQRPASIETLTVTIPPEKVRTKPLERFQEAKRTVDLAQAEIIVSVGRGIKDQENLPLIQKLAEALGAEVGGSRPICDNGWLPMERQIGSSGQTVAPKLYLAVGISGAIQHLVGMKGSRTVVAINKDPHAPIFEVADYGIVGNLFDVLPALIEEVNKAKDH
ncbi:MAG: electron transfer flavoprotein subunit alpha [Acidobacteria bacterium RIFCSPLOWO2_02_FULL_61_28]|nr:MAG: electron transfer flavoprotein subunit alpha [Acidobacteria bacterium RIFCSPLOWO2_02_FULL_61_28]